ncbi:hypothetical protein H2200_000276 [Cladophialophora chaetospira]|uniref:N-acetylglucosamine-induced protein 1 n=1 Tax=Cladophialophora chaetospira TaxID=386627 RepID=A0AA39CQ65_9EURO|nr:hypothetical protein H2200_000276 [Cladophialophora chaetospira]
MPHSVHPTPRGNTPELSINENVSILWWNANQPREIWTEECPAYLLGQSEKNVGILTKTDDEFTRFDWTKCQELVKAHNIHHFQRCPSQLRGYLQYIHHLKKTFGSVLSYIQHERLQWEAVTPSGDVPFSNPSDFKTLYNDWPYFIDEKIVHLVVWTKFLIDEDPETGDVLPEATDQIEAFIDRTFCEGETGKTIPRERIVWFKNWKSLKSVHALEHFHVMLYNPPGGLLDAVTHGDRPTCESWMPDRD